MRCFVWPQYLVEPQDIEGCFGERDWQIEMTMDEYVSLHQGFLKSTVTKRHEFYSSSVPDPNMIASARVDS